MSPKAFAAFQVLLLAGQASAIALPGWAKLGRRQLPAIVEEIDLPINPPEIVEHIGLDSGAAEDLLASLSSAFLPAPTPDIAPDARRRAAPSERRRSTSVTSTTTTTTDAQQLSERQDASSPFIPITNSASDCEQVVINGPFTSLQSFVGKANVLRLTATDMEGKTSDIIAGDQDITDSGVFTFSPNERITEMVIYADGPNPTGFRFKTDAGREYNSLGTDQVITLPEITVGNIGSGIIARIRGNPCDNGILGSFGFDFLDELESIGISDISYAGFTNNILPSGPGQSLTVGSQAINNINGTASQTTSIQTQDAMVKQRSITVTNQWNVGGSVSVQAEVGLPFVTKSSVTATANWGFQQSTADQSLEGQTVQRSTTVGLSCPAGKFCLGTSFVTIFNLDVSMEATFRAKTKQGATFEWIQSGRYKGADSFALELRIDESDTPLNTAPTS